MLMHATYGIGRILSMSIIAPGISDKISDSIVMMVKGNAIKRLIMIFASPAYIPILS